MSPTVERGDWVIEDTRVGELHVDSIVSFLCFGVAYMKRVKGVSVSLFLHDNSLIHLSSHFVVVMLKNDNVEICQGRTFLNGVEQVEEFIQHPASYHFHPPIVPHKYLLMFGDNRDFSHDSHLWKDPFIHEDEVLGRVIYVCKSKPIRVLTLGYYAFVDGINGMRGMGKDVV